MYGQLMDGGKQFVHCREVVLLLECPLSEVLLCSIMYNYYYYSGTRPFPVLASIIACIMAWYSARHNFERNHPS